MSTEDKFVKKAHELIDDTAGAVKKAADKAERTADDLKDKKDTIAEEVHQRVVDAADKAKDDVERAGK